MSARTIERFDAEDVKAGTDLTALFEHYTYGRNGKYSCPLPDHDDNDPSLSVKAYPDGEQRFKCHGCGWNGDALTLVQEREGLDFPDAIEWLARWSSVSPSSGPGGLDHKPRPKPKPKPTARILQPVTTEDGQIEDTDDHLGQFAEQRNLHRETLEALGVTLVRRYGHKRLRFPFRTGDGTEVSAQDRKIEQGDKYDKWLTLKGAPAIAYNVGGYDNAEADRWAIDGAEGVLVVVEGVTDTIALLDRFGLDYPVIGLPGANNLGGPGSSRTAEADRFATGARGLVVVVIGDNDNAGRNFRKRVAELHTGHLTQLYVPEEFNDVGEWVAETGDQFGDQWKAALAEGVDR